jgi:hypothetical protein
MRWPGDDIPRTAAGVATMGQVGRALRDRTEAEREAATRAIAATLAPLVSDGWITLPARVWLFAATNPG